jgi:hypothetical protein
MRDAKPPLRARLHWYRLTPAEFVLLTAMCEHCSDGSVVWAAVPRLAAYAKLSERKVQYLIRALCGRGVLSQLAPPNGARRRPATYLINEAALEDDPRMAPYHVRQQRLPSSLPPSASGEPIAADPVHGVHPSDADDAPHPVHSVHQSGAQPAPDSKSFDSGTSHSKPMTQHGDAALNSMPAWLALKEQLRTELSDQEWQLWVRPMYLLKAMSLRDNKKHLLAAVPPNGRIQQAALDRLPMMRSLLAPAGLNISLTPYPNEWQIAEAKERYGVDIAPKPWARRGDA